MDLARSKDECPCMDLLLSTPYGRVLEARTGLHGAKRVHGRRPVLKARTGLHGAKRVHRRRPVSARMQEWKQHTIRHKVVQAGIWVGGGALL
jgi:hypothetical protein